MAMRRVFASLLIAASSVLAACHTSPPPRWAEGGAPLAIGRARWERGSDTVDVLEDGKVLVDGDHIWTLDRAGRIYESDRDPVAVLLPEGPLGGVDDNALGHVGLANASPPGSTTAWLTVGPGGEVTIYDPDGARRAGGAWTGCQGPQFRTCTLVTHLVLLREVQRRPRMTFGVGVGVGMYR
jgi:hypothetical protein